MSMITTHNLGNPVKVEPKKLSHITTSIIPNAVPQPAPVGDGFAKLITTHDEPPAIPGSDFKRDVDDMSKDKAETAAREYVNQANAKLADKMVDALTPVKSKPGRKPVAKKRGAVK